jgi:hypothetical protein
LFKVPYKRLILDFILDIKEITLKHAINLLSKDLNDIEYLRKIKAYIKVVKRI